MSKDENASSYSDRMREGIIVLVCYLILFGSQVYFYYFNFIPESLAEYDAGSAVHTHIKKIVDTLLGQGLIWFFLAISAPIGRILGAMIETRRKKRSD